MIVLISKFILDKMLTPNSWEESGDEEEEYHAHKGTRQIFY